MALVKCPRCELNYILDGEKLCTVCRREVRGEVTGDDLPELCSECGEHPVVPGEELCLFCLKVLGRHSAPAVPDGPIVTDESALGIDSVSGMDEIEIDMDGDAPPREFEELDEKFDDADDAEEAQEDAPADEFDEDEDDEQ